GLDPDERQRLRPGQDIRTDDHLAADVPEEVDRLFRAAQPRKISVDDNPVEAVVHKQQQIFKKMCEQLHGDLSEDLYCKGFEEPLEWAGERSSVEQRNSGSRGGLSVWPTRSGTCSVVLLNDRVGL